MDKIQPPNGFSFIGLAEIVKEFRELIKDLSYRNKHETMLCELEVLEKLTSITEKTKEATETKLTSLALIPSDQSSHIALRIFCRVQPLQKE